ncbi:MAG: deoxyribose-phosphate aldolase [Pseudomonadota bacterium]
MPSERKETRDARRALSLLDLTSLNDSDDEAAIAALCKRALTPAGKVAAVCVYPRLACVARRALEGTGVRVAAVVDFPAGNASPAAAAREAKAALAEGAEEIDMVFPYRRFMAGRRAQARAGVAAVRAAAGPRTTLKVILETGVLKSPELIAAASREAISAGADFLKTSTGKVAVGATPAAARTMLEAIREARRSRRTVGFKAAGGVKTLEQARAYLELADAILGPAWASSRTLRIGASGLLDDLLRRLGHGTGAGERSRY